MVSSGICGGPGDFGFEVVGFLFLDVDVPCSPSCGCVFLSLFVLQKCVLVFVNSTVEAYF